MRMSSDAPDPLAGSEATWVTGLRAGDPAAFEAVHAHYAPRIMSHLRHLSAASAEDLAQTTWLLIARAAPSLRPDTRLGPWIFTIARNAWRAERRSAWLTAKHWVELVARTAPAAPPSPDTLTVVRELSQRTSEAITRLPPNLREAILLVGVQGLEPSEAAAVVGLSPEAMRQRVARARQALKDDLTRTESTPQRRSQA
jgi:RNA polymerase sigma-70 factor (ECF subfamily)